SPSTSPSTRPVCLRATALVSATSVVRAMARASSDPAQPVAPARHTFVVMPDSSPTGELGSKTLDAHERRVGVRDATEHRRRPAEERLIEKGTSVGLDDPQCKKRVRCLRRIAIRFDEWFVTEAAVRDSWRLHADSIGSARDVGEQESRSGGDVATERVILRSRHLDRREFGVGAGPRVVAAVDIHERLPHGAARGISREWQVVHRAVLVETGPDASVELTGERRRFAAGGVAERADAREGGPTGGGGGGSVRWCGEAQPRPHEAKVGRLDMDQSGDISLAAELTVQLSTPARRRRAIRDGVSRARNRARYAPAREDDKVRIERVGDGGDDVAMAREILVLRRVR